MIKFRLKTIFPFFLFLLTMAGACDDKQDPVQESDGGSGGVVTYSSDIKPLLENNCLRCHSAFVSGAARNGAPVDVNFDTYNDIFALADRANQRIQAGTMPPTGPLSDSEKALFQEWIDDGKLENAPQLQASTEDTDDFANYQTWDIIDNFVYPIDLPLLKDAHHGNDPDYTRQIYANAQWIKDRFAPESAFVLETFRWMNGEKEYAVSGGILVMVKRGGSFNPDGNGWEWLELNSHDLGIIASGGAEMESGACNSCHRNAAKQSGGLDMVFKSP